MAVSSAPKLSHCCGLCLDQVLHFYDFFKLDYFYLAMI